MATFRFVFISILMLSSGWAAQNFLTVSVCPRDQNSWTLESDRKKCQGDTPDYLCAAIENQVGNFGEICTKFGLTPANKCAVLNEQTHNLDSVDCKAPSGCPSQPYIPSVLWQYQICYEDFYGTTTSLAPTTTQDITSATTNSGPEDGGSGTGVGVVVAMVIILFIVAVVMVVFFVRNQFGFKDNVQQRITTDAENGEAQSTQVPLLVEKKVTNTSNTGGIKEDGQKDKNDEPPEKKIEKLEELLKYLVHILKQELGVSDLKEKVVIHSKSVNEHFSELIKNMHSVRDLNNYSQLDPSLVFAFLRNFCESVKPPSRGWDYEPPDDETHTGADIERIRYMWNKYCDNDFEFKHLDDVSKRMKQKYGTFAVHGDDGESHLKKDKNTEGFKLRKNKIQSIKLNPDCIVEKGIVITERITTALKIVKSKNVVILKGVIGCGKTHALKAIQNHFQGIDWETAWMDSKNLQGEMSYEKPTILLCDNLFGKFGRSVFAQDTLNQTEEVLKKIEKSEQTKVVIGIHTHVYDEVKKKMNLNFLHQKNITVEMDNLSEAETLLIFKKQLEKGHCKKDFNCWFKSVGFQSVLDKLSKNQGHIGGPFLSLMYCNHHEFFSEEAFSVNPVQTLLQHFQRMKHDNRSLYSCLVYLMCVQQHNLNEEPEKWAGEISVDITKHALEKISNTNAYVLVETQAATLAHDILTIVLFRFAAENEEYLLPVVMNSELDMMLQLWRPPAGTPDNDFECDFMDVNKNVKYRTIGKEFVYRYASNYRENEMLHPLFAIDFVKRKYALYSKHPPKHKKKSN
ncbi:uncharacterized protein [Magallana gigas]|uniref:uncharacterized protein isoform X3 n=1 Tax=Magallana gigas TaxID=29159 RepID=UPI00333F5F71